MVGPTVRVGSERVAGKPSAADGGATGVGSALLVPHAATEAIPRPASLQVAAGMTLFVGLIGTVMGGAHLEGVIQTAMTKGYAYDLRLEFLLLLGIGMVFASVLCLTAVRGLANGQRRAWDRAVIGALLLLLVTAPIIPHPKQGEMAAGLSVLAAVNLVALMAAWRRLETDPFSPAVAPEPRTASGTKLVNACGSCGQVLNPTWDKCLHCGASVADDPPVPRYV